MTVRKAQTLSKDCYMIALSSTAKLGNPGVTTWTVEPYTLYLSRVHEHKGIRARNRVAEKRQIEPVWYIQVSHWQGRSRGSMVCL